LYSTDGLFLRIDKLDEIINVALCKIFDDISNGIVDELIVIVFPEKD
jgi:hypothetical protein